VFEDVRYRDAEAELQEGCPILLYTDGLTEVRRDGAILGEEGLARSLERLCVHPVEELPGLLLGEALLFSEGVLNDDLAILAVRYTGRNGLRVKSPSVDLECAAETADTQAEAR
jgi:serine phosphatase RsbU (regulator of sigma subunit)